MISMTSPETPKTIEEILFGNKDKILSTKFLFDLHPPEDRSEELIMIGNFADLTGEGGMSEDEYRVLFEKCAKQGDFTDLAMKYSVFTEERYHTFLADQPSLPEYGDDLRPGKSNIETALGGEKGHRQGVLNRKKQSGRNPISNIGSPSIRLTPDWVLAIEQSGMRMREVFDFLEKKGEANTQTMTAPKIVETQTRREIKHDLT